MSNKAKTLSGYLNGKETYLAGGMFAVDDDGTTWRELITPKLEEYGVSVQDPTKKTAYGMGEVAEDKKRFKVLLKTKQFDQAKKDFEIIVRKDLRAVDKSDFIIVYYDSTIHTFGTIHEIIEAHRQRKPILVKYDESQLETMNIWLLAVVKTEWMFATWDDLFEYLNKIDRREITEFDKGFWTPE